MRRDHRDDVVDRDVAEPDECATVDEIASHYGVTVNRDAARAASQARYAAACKKGQAKKA